jgi:hypothetical protein
MALVAARHGIRGGRQPARSRMHAGEAGALTEKRKTSHPAGNAATWPYTGLSRFFGRIAPRDVPRPDIKDYST